MLCSVLFFSLHMHNGMQTDTLQQAEKWCFIHFEHLLESETSKKDCTLLSQASIYLCIPCYVRPAHVGLVI